MNEQQKKEFRVLMAFLMDQCPHILGMHITVCTKDCVSGFQIGKDESIEPFLDLVSGIVKSVSQDIGEALEGIRSEKGGNCALN